MVKRKAKTKMVSMEGRELSFPSFSLSLSHHGISGVRSLSTGNTRPRCSHKQRCQQQKTQRQWQATNPTAKRGGVVILWKHLTISLIPFFKYVYLWNLVHTFLYKDLIPLWVKWIIHKNVTVVKTYSWIFKSHSNYVVFFCFFCCAIHICSVHHMLIIIYWIFLRNFTTKYL